MKYLISLIGVGIGALVVIYSEKIYQAFGRVDWAEQHLGVEGGSRIFYKLIGIAVIIFSLLYMSGILESLVVSIFGRMFGL